jgi:hypothetical protein
MARLNSEISQWEKRIKAQGRVLSKKKGGPPPKRICKGSPNNEVKRQGCDDAQTIKQDAKLVKPKINRSLFNNPAGAKYKTKEDKSVRPTKIVLRYLDAWNTSMFPRLREFRSAKDEGINKQTKTYQTAVYLLKKLIKGTLYDGSEPSVRFPAGFQAQLLRIPIERFQYLVTNLEKKAFNSDYKPRNKTYLIKTTLPLFLVGNGTFGVSPSLLLDYALTPAIPNTNTKPKDPKLAEIFRELFLFKVDRLENTLTFAERNHLVGASNKYLDFFTRFKEPFEVYGYKDPVDFLDEYYWKAISDSWPGRRIRKIPLNYLNSGGLIDRVIIPYFLKIGMLKDYDFIDNSVFKK